MKKLQISKTCYVDMFNNAKFLCSVSLFSPVAPSAVTYCTSSDIQILAVVANKICAFTCSLIVFHSDFLVGSNYILFWPSI